MAPTIPIERVDHIGIRVRNLKDALAFYGVLGFDLVRRAEADDVAIIRNEHGVELNLVFNANAGDPSAQLRRGRARLGVHPRPRPEHHRAARSGRYVTLILPKRSQTLAGLGRRNKTLKSASGRPRLKAGADRPYHQPLDDSRP
jgi:catechol 2,3-dioxygenase-like lactoylglutathione lyase family enzyme